MSVQPPAQLDSGSHEDEAMVNDTEDTASTRTLADLPTEILLEIAKWAQAIAVVNSTSLHPGKTIPTNQPQIEDSKGPGICQCRGPGPPTPVAVGLQTKSPANACISLSSTSQRLRSVLFDNNPEQDRALPYCGCWMRASMEMPLRIRSGYRYVFLYLLNH
jgi:hypothetical protein